MYDFRRQPQPVGVCVCLTFHKSINLEPSVYTFNLHYFSFIFLSIIFPQHNLTGLFCRRVFIFDPNSAKIRFRSAGNKNAAPNVHCNCCCSFCIAKEIVMSSHKAPTFAHAQMHSLATLVDVIRLLLRVSTTT